MRKTWTESDAQRLRDLREQAGTPQAAFAKRHALSVGQVRELEGGKAGSFYSEDIKAHTGRRLLAALGYVAPPEPVEPAAAPAQDDAPSLPAEDARGPQAPQELEPEPPFEPASEPEQPLPADASPDPVPQEQATAPQAEAPGLDAGAPRAGQVAPRRGLAPVLAIGLVVVIAGVWVLTGRNSPGASAVLTVTEPVPVATASAEPRASEPAPAASVPASGASAPAAAASSAATAGAARLPAACEVPPGRTPTSYQSPVADRPATYVHLEATRDAQICVVDAQNQARVVTLKAGESTNVTGTPPFTVRSAQWSDLKVYFQGLRVQLEPGAATDPVLILPRRVN